ncbi:hypothetical protein GCM10009715_40150 [Paeniglutamicibacter psychrophenolicus]
MNATLAGIGPRTFHPGGIPNTPVIHKGCGGAADGRFHHTPRPKTVQLGGSPRLL